MLFKLFTLIVWKKILYLNSSCIFLPQKSKTLYSGHLVIAGTFFRNHKCPLSTGLTVYNTQYDLDTVQIVIISLSVSSSKLDYFSCKQNDFFFFPGLVGQKNKEKNKHSEKVIDHGDFLCCFWLNKSGIWEREGWKYCRFMFAFYSILFWKRPPLMFHPNYQNGGIVKLPVVRRWLRN